MKRSNQHHEDARYWVYLAIACAASTAAVWMFT